MTLKCFNYVFLLLQELSSRLNNTTQEKNDLLNQISSLEESVSSADSERKTWQEKISTLTEGRAELENKMASVTESLETEKQV